MILIQTENWSDLYYQNQKQDSIQFDFFALHSHLLVHVQGKKKALKMTRLTNSLHLSCVHRDSQLTEPLMGGIFLLNSFLNLYFLVNIYWTCLILTCKGHNYEFKVYL